MTPKKEADASALPEFPTPGSDVLDEFGGFISTLPEFNLEEQDTFSYLAQRAVGLQEPRTQPPTPERPDSAPAEPDPVPLQQVISKPASVIFDSEDLRNFVGDWPATRFWVNWYCAYHVNAHGGRQQRNIGQHLTGDYFVYLKEGHQKVGGYILKGEPWKGFFTFICRHEEASAILGFNTPTPPNPQNMYLKLFGPKHPNRRAGVFNHSADHQVINLRTQPPHLTLVVKRVADPSASASASANNWDLDYIPSDAPDSEDEDIDGSDLEDSDEEGARYRSERQAAGFLARHGTA